MTTIYFKDSNNAPFYDPSEAVIAKHNLTPISEEEFNQIVTAINTPTVEQLAESARAKRNQLIAETDYLMMPDYPVSAEVRASVETYRQSLRDITEQAGFPESIEWPVRPEGV